MSKKIAELRKGLEMVKGGIDLIIASMDEEVVEAPKEESKTKSKSEIKREKLQKEETTEEEEVLDEPKKTVSAKTVEEIDALSYNELKTLAKELGVKDTKIRKPELLKLVKEALDGSDLPDEEEVEEPKKKAPAGKKKESNVVPFKKKKDEEDETDEEVEQDPVMEMILSQTEDMTDEEIAELLVGAGVRASGKRQALLAKVVKAFEAGKITFDDEPEEDDEEEVEVENTPKRKRAIAKTEKEINKLVDDEEIYQEDIEEFLTKFNGVEDAADLEIDEDDLVDEYIKAKLLMVDDDGKTNEFSDCYEIGGEAYCCGHLLDYDDKEGVYTCTICGEEYDAE